MMRRYMNAVQTLTEAAAVRFTLPSDIAPHVTFHGEFDPTTRIAHIFNIGSSRKGYGTKAVTAFEQWAKAQGAWKITGESVPQSLPFWWKLGYRDHHYAIYKVLHEGVAQTLTEARYPRVPSSDALSKAEQSGFDVAKLWYHGTRKRFDGFRLPKEEGIDELGPGVYVTSEQWLANTWARKGGFVLTCVVRHGKLFDLEQLRRPETMAILASGYHQYQVERWHDDSAYDFSDVWKSSRYQSSLANLCLSTAGYVGGYKRDSQIAGQIVVFKPEDVLIVARMGGQ